MSLVVSGEAQDRAIPAAEQARARIHPDVHHRAVFPAREPMQVGRAALYCDQNWCQPLQNPSPWLQTPPCGSSLPCCSTESSLPHSCLYLGPRCCITEALPLPSLRCFPLQPQSDASGLRKVQVVSSLTHHQDGGDDGTVALGCSPSSPLHPRVRVVQLRVVGICATAASCATSTPGSAQPPGMIQVSFNVFFYG